MSWSYIAGGKASLSGSWGSRGLTGPTAQDVCIRKATTNPPTSPDVTPDVLQAIGDTIRDSAISQEWSWLVLSSA